MKLGEASSNDMKGLPSVHLLRGLWVPLAQALSEDAMFSKCFQRRECLCDGSVCCSSMAMI